MAKGLKAWVRFGLRHELTELDLDPQHSPRLGQIKDELREKFHKFADSPDGFDAQFDETVTELREKFCEANPSLRIRYAKAQPAVTEH